jgi:hypothetical protein
MNPSQQQTPTNWRSKMKTLSIHQETQLIVSKITMNKSGTINGNSEWAAQRKLEKMYQEKFLMTPKQSETCALIALKKHKSNIAA